MGAAAASGGESRVSAAGTSLAVAAAVRRGRLPRRSYRPRNCLLPSGLKQLLDELQVPRMPSLGELLRSFAFSFTSFSAS